MERLYWKGKRISFPRTPTYTNVYLFVRWIGLSSAIEYWKSRLDDRLSPFRRLKYFPIVVNSFCRSSLFPRYRKTIRDFWDKNKLFFCLWWIDQQQYFAFIFTGIIRKPNCKRYHWCTHSLIFRRGMSYRRGFVRCNYGRWGQPSLILIDVPFRTTAFEKWTLFNANVSCFGSPFFLFPPLKWLTNHYERRCTNTGRCWQSKNGSYYAVFFALQEKRGTIKPLKNARTILM